MRLRTIFLGLAAFLALAWTLPAARAAADLQLAGSTYSLEVASSSTAATDWRCAYTDMTSPPAGGSGAGQITTAGTTTIVAAPSGSTIRKVVGCDFRNTSTTTAQTLTVQVDISATNRTIGNFVLQAGWALRFAEGRGWWMQDATGRDVERAFDIAGYSGKALAWWKTGATSEAVGLWYGHWKDAGFPGAWSPGSPGLNGNHVNCDTTADATATGSPLLSDPGSGSYYITQAGFATSVAHLVQIIDVLWYNTGITVTTTGAQSITFGTLNARDVNGSTNGEGLAAGLYLHAASTNAGAITNTVISYTDSDGNAGNTGSIPSVPANPNAGAFFPFSLATGDRGIRSIENITLGTSYVTGQLHLIVYRPLLTIPNPVANVGGIMAGLPNFGPPGVRIYNDSCLAPIYLASATTATNTAGTLSVMER